DRDGDVCFDSTEAHAVMTSALEDRGGYVFDLTHGSKIARIKSLTSRTPSQAQAAILESLAAQERSGSITNVSVRATALRTTGRLIVEIGWTTPGNDEFHQQS